jgi:tetratricopeptide (TPR) repeat protein
VLSDLGRFADAARDCDRARSLDPDSLWTRTASGLLEQARGRPREALAYSRLVLRSNGDVAEVHFSRALQFMQLGMARQARASYESLLTLAGESAREDPEYARLGLRTAFGVGGAEAMRRQIGEQKLDASKDPRLLLTLADAELLAGDAPAARRYVDRALALPEADNELLADPRRARNGDSWLLIAAAAEDATGARDSAKARLKQLDQLLDRMAADGVRTHGMYELRANMAALRGDAGSARDALRTAVGLGWRATYEAEREPYFRDLRGDPEIAALFAEVDARNAVDARLVQNEDSAG